MVCRLLARVCSVTTNQLHTARHGVKHVQDFKLELSPHPPYLPHLAPSNFHLFWPLKDALLVRNFKSDEEVEEAERDWLAQQPKDLYRGICV
jgi:hypothetical protein